MSDTLPAQALAGPSGDVIGDIMDAQTVTSVLGTSADVLSLVGLPLTLIQWFQGAATTKESLSLTSYLEYLRRTDNTALREEIESSSDKQNECLAQIEKLRQETQGLLVGMPQALGDVVLQNLFDFNAHAKDSADSEFEAHYPRHLKQRYGMLRTLGVREMRELNQELSIAYVSLNLAAKGSVETDAELAPLSAEWQMMRNPYMTIQGPAGSGKTTLLHWVATRCADTEEPRNPWRGGVPFIVSLRRLPDSAKGRPRASDFVSYSVDADVFTATPPPGWIDRIWQNKRGILLIDGLDEISPNFRPAFWEWLSSWVNSHPGNRCYITSRFLSGGDDAKSRNWSPPKAFVATHVKEMSDEDVHAFVAKWHQSVSDTEVENDERRAIMKAAEQLPKRLSDPANQRVRELCRTPLLCALVCALHWREEGYLPARRVDLYDRCCKMLVEERDRKRDIKPPDGALGKLTLSDKEMLLQRLAWSMMINAMDNKSGDQRTEIDRAQAIRWLRPHLKACDDPDARKCDPELVLNHLLDRTGLLRMPAKGRIDFPHRTFQEYLAACAAGFYDDVVDLAKRSMNDQWHETIILAAGTPFGGIGFGNRLIEELLRRGEELKQERARNLSLALAMACLETGKQVRRDLEKRVLKHLGLLVPPKTWAAARHLVPAGDALLPYLRYDRIKQRGWRAVALSAHVIARVGTHKAIEMLTDKNGYGNDSRNSVLDQIATCANLNILRVPIVQTLLSSDAMLPYSVVRGLRTADDLSPLVGLPITRLDISGNRTIEDFSPLGKLLELRRLLLDETHISDLDVGVLAELRHLEQLTIGGTKITDFGMKSIRDLAELRLLGLSNVDISDAALIYVEKLRRLQKLWLTSASVTDAGLAALENLQDLRELDVGGTLISDKGVESIVHLHGVRLLSLASTEVTDNCVSVLKRLPNLEWLNLSGTAISDAAIPDLLSFENLSGLNLAGTRVSETGLQKLGVKIHHLSTRDTYVRFVGGHYGMFRTMPSRSQPAPRARGS